MAFDEFWESRQICLRLGKVGSAKAGQSVSPDGNPTPTVQPSPESNDTLPGNPSRANPETRGTNDQGYNLNALSALIGGTICGLWELVHSTWRIVFPSKLEHGFYIEMGGYELVSELGEGRDLPSGFKGRVTPQAAIELDKNNLLEQPSLELINDQSKSDILAKFLVCLQTSWMVIQCIARVAQSLPLTLLELHTVMNAICAFFIYCLWLKKPHDVRVPTYIGVNDERLKKLKDIVNGSPPPFSLIEAEPDAGFMAVARSSCGLSKPKHSEMSKRVMTWLVFPIYGGIHLTEWKGHFPTNLERILWRASALSIMGLPFLGHAGTLFFKWMRNQFGKGPQKDSQKELDLTRWRWLILTLRGIAFVCWVLARVYVVVESFASLRNLPKGSYTAVSWVSLIPHF